MRIIRSLFVFSLVLYLLLLSPSANAQKTLEQFFKDELGLSFLIIDRAEFGVGTLVQGRGKKLTIQCWAEQCIPRISDFKKNGEIKESKKIGTVQIGQQLKQNFKVTAKLLSMLGLGIGIEKIKSGNITLVNPLYEEISLQTINNIYDSGYLTREGMNALSLRKKPRTEFVFQALRCDSLEFIFYDENNKIIDVDLNPTSSVTNSKQGTFPKAKPATASNAKPDAAQDSKLVVPPEPTDTVSKQASKQGKETSPQSSGKIVFSSPRWVAFRGAVFEKGKPVIADPLMEPSRQTEFKETKTQSDLLDYSDFSIDFWPKAEIRGRLEQLPDLNPNSPPDLNRYFWTIDLPSPISIRGLTIGAIEVSFDKAQLEALKGKEVIASGHVTLFRNSGGELHPVLEADAIRAVPK
jgi:hypothetical protein